MCLTINTDIHTERVRYRNFKKMPKPFIADKDIYCFKYLTRSGNFDIKFFTPFFCEEVVFDAKGMAVMESDVKKRKYPFSIWSEVLNEYNVDNGIHSYTTQTPMAAIVFDAVIPKGSMYYIGQDNDLVSEKLIVFQNRTAFLVYNKENEVTDTVWFLLNKDKEK